MVRGADLCAKAHADEVRPELAARHAERMLCPRQAPSPPPAADHPPRQIQPQPCTGALLTHAIMVQGLMQSAEVPGNHVILNRDIQDAEQAGLLHRHKLNPLWFPIEDSS